MHFASLLEALKAKKSKRANSHLQLKSERYLHMKGAKYSTEATAEKSDGRMLTFVGVCRDYRPIRSDPRLCFGVLAVNSSWLANTNNGR